MSAEPGSKWLLDTPHECVIMLTQTAVCDCFLTILHRCGLRTATCWLLTLSGILLSSLKFQPVVTGVVPSLSKAAAMHVGMGMTDQKSPAVFVCPSTDHSILHMNKQSHIRIQTPAGLSHRLLAVCIQAVQRFCESLLPLHCPCCKLSK